ncbi:ATP-dependent acyl-CoA ligase [Vreelandella titanicae]|uniref:ATP-dependent acyl-CoA ligase n=1 Tax=Vreelandella titanicae TaxID=664683 RepID=UPI0031DDC8BD
MGQWDDKFERAERKWATWRMQEYAQTERVLPQILEDKARRFPDREIFQFREGAITFEALNACINRAANGFLALGVRPGDKVALMLPNCPEFLYAWFGLNKIGAVNVPINVAQRGVGLAHQIHHTDCVALLADEPYLEHLEVIVDQLPSLRHLVVRRNDGAPPRLPSWPSVGSLGYDELTAWAETAPGIEVSFRDLSSILFTSGTTGPSKGVMISHHYWYEIWSQAVRSCRYTEDDVLYTGLPFFHSSAKGTTIGPAILADAKAVLVERFSASRMLDDCRRWNCTEAKYIGSVIPILMKQPPSERDADNPLRLMVGAAAPVNLWEAFQERFNTRLLEVYGMTECTVALVNPMEDRRPGSCGKPLTGYDVRVVDEDDNEVAPGEIGEIIVQPRRMFLGTTGYYKNPEATLELFRNFWIHTGDLGRCDEEGYFYYVDRKKQALRRRGENISSFEVEAVLNTHPAVLESCVVGVPAELGEEEVKAVLVLREGETLSEEALIRWCEPRLAYFAIPRYLAFRDALPKTPSERVEKYKLKAEGVASDCWDREAARVVLARH